ncbi:hypothetical protein DYBT9623_00677 [Dyadobacter sp. CECT 9623]|uniref:Uncharacterized protein n=1 Tax=Dyadobacter linearis TaxID=2823330 RepID=A0ABM8UKF7_9BACT|nr:hypothetical protein DYBT9623_00677 [Dyadobacter sp. CECT 9623]
MQKQEFKGATYQEITNAIRNRNQSGSIEDLIRFIDRTVKPLVPPIDAKL